MTKQTNLELAIEKFNEIEDIQSKEFVHRRVNHCLPKKKRLTQERILTQLMVRGINAKSQFATVYGKLSSIEMQEFRKGRTVLIR